MRAAPVVVLLVLVGEPARAEGPAPPVDAPPRAAATLAIGAVDPALAALAPCLTAEALGAEVRRAIPSLERVGAPAPGVTTLSLQRLGGELVVALGRREVEGPERSDRHAVPLGSDCRTLLDTVASIVTRALEPIGFQPLPPVRRAVLPPVLVQVPRPSPPAPPPPSPPLPPDGPPPAPEPPPSPPASRAAPARSGAEVAPFQIAISARLNLSPDGVTPGAGGLLTLAFRHRHFVIFAGAGLEQPVGYRSDTAHVQMQRVPSVAGLAYELDIPGGAVRLGAAALVEVWAVAQDDPAGHASATWVHGGVLATVAYHFRPARLVDVFAGLDFEQSFSPHRFTASDFSLAGTSPAQWWSPHLGLSLNL